MIYVLDTKICSKCGETKTIDEFPKTRKRCIECKRADDKKYQKLYHSRKMAQDPAYRKRKQKNAKVWRSENKERYLSVAKVWKEENYEKWLDSDRRNKNRRRNSKAKGFATTKQIEARMEYYGYLCIYCKSPYQEVDHFYPLSKGGTNWPANLVPACSPCNRSKYNKNPWEFIASLKEKN